MFWENAVCLDSTINQVLFEVYPINIISPTSIDRVMQMTGKKSWSNRPSIWRTVQTRLILSIKFFICFCAAYCRSESILPYMKGLLQRAQNDRRKQRENYSVCKINIFRRMSSLLVSKSTLHQKFVSLVITKNTFFMNSTIQNIISSWQLSRAPCFVNILKDNRKLCSSLFADIVHFLQSNFNFQL